MLTYVDGLIIVSNYSICIRNWVAIAIFINVSFYLILEEYQFTYWILAALFISGQSNGGLCALTVETANGRLGILFI